MKMARRGAFLLAVCALMTLASCGGGGEGGDSTTAENADTTSRPAKAPAKTASRADAVCRQMLRGVKRIAKRALERGYPTTLALTTEGFARPGLHLIERVARRQQAIARTSGDPNLETYADLFEPIIVLAEKRLHAGLDQDSAESVRLQELLTGLGEEQRQAARMAGLRSCDVDFLAALVHAAT